MPTSKKKQANSVAATSGARELERKRFLKRWWWFDPAHAGEKYEAALAWETIRRTRSYQALWRKYKKETVPLLHQEGKSTLAGAMQQMHFFQQARAALGNLYFDYLMKGFNPDLTWLELEEWQRLTARGFILGENYALKANKEYLLPRQEADQPTLSVGIVRLHRDGSGELRFDQNRSVGPAIRNVEGTELFSSLRLNTPGEYAFVYFDTCGSREALLEAFDAEMQRWLGTALPPSGEKMDGKYWEDIARKNERLATRWNPQDKSPAEFWVPQTREANVRVKATEHAIMPSDNPPCAFLMVSTRYGPAALRSVFHTHLKSAQFKKWHAQCVDFWRNITFAGRGVFDATKHLPPTDKPKRSARRKDLWLGLAANDVARAGTPLGKSSPEGAFLLSHSPSYKALHNAKASAETRLGELDETAGRPDKKLGHWNDKSAEMSSNGFFQAAAGEAPLGPG